MNSSKQKDIFPITVVCVYSNPSTLNTGTNTQSKLSANSLTSSSCDTRNSFKMYVAVADVTHSRACMFDSMKMVGFPYDIHQNRIKTSTAYKTLHSLWRVSPLYRIIWRHAMCDSHTICQNRNLSTHPNIRAPNRQAMHKSRSSYCIAPIQIQCALCPPVVRHRLNYSRSRPDQMHGSIQLTSNFGGKYYLCRFSVLISLFSPYSAIFPLR